MTQPQRGGGFRGRGRGGREGRPGSSGRHHQGPAAAYRERQPVPEPTPGSEAMESSSPPTAGAAEGATATEAAGLVSPDSGQLKAPAKEHGGELASSSEHQQEQSQQYVVLVRDLPPHVSEIDLTEAFGVVGNVSRVWTLPQKRQALVEFSESKSVVRAVELSRSGILGPISVSESDIPRIMHRGDGFPGPNRVLLLIVYREECPVTIETLQRACSQFGGRVCRIVMFRKQLLLHAMVEFGRIDQAVTAKARLNGTDIFDGCCSIKADFAQPTELTVTRNDSDSWDFTRDLPRHLPHQPPHHQHHGSQHPMPHHPAPGVNPVLLISGLESGSFTCDRLFNLLCLYGNVLRICLLAQPPGQPPPPTPLPPPPPGCCIGALAEMGDSESANRVGNCLDGIRMFGARMRVHPTGHRRLTNDTVPPTIVLARADYTESENNRYTTPRQAASNRPLPPFRALYFWNCPPALQEHQLRGVLSDLGCPQPQSVLRFSNARATDKTSGGMVQWPSEVMAIETLVLANNKELTGLGQQERGGNFVLRMRFADRAIGQKEEEQLMAMD